MILVLAIALPASAQRTYENTLTPIKDPRPLLADYPQWVEPVREAQRFEAPILVNDEGADLDVRAWRFSYNARGIIEMPNKLRAAETAVICVHPWGIDDGQGWNTPEPAGVCDMCTPWKNHLAAKHTSGVIDPFLKSLRGKAGFIMYSLPGDEDDIRKKLYRSFTNKPTEAERAQGRQRTRREAARLQVRGRADPRDAADLRKTRRWSITSSSSPAWTRATATTARATGNCRSRSSRTSTPIRTTSSSTTRPATAR
jgi:hypothetical protein